MAGLSCAASLLLSSRYVVVTFLFIVEICGSVYRTKVAGRGNATVRRTNFVDWKNEVAEGPQYLTASGHGGCKITFYNSVLWR
jgi:hypothetical protein